MYNKSMDYIVAKIYIVNFCVILLVSDLFFLNDTSHLLSFVDFFSSSFHKIWLIHYTSVAMVWFGLVLG